MSNINQMHHEILLRLNELGAYQHEDFLPEEIDIYINDASLKLVKDRFESIGNRSFKGFEQSVKRVADLSPLIITDNIVTSYGGEFGSFFIDQITKPSNYLFFINQYCQTQKSDTTTATVDNNKRIIDSNIIKYSDGKFVQHDDLLAVLQDPFNETYNECPIFTITNTVNFYATDNFVVDNVNLTYLKKPQTVKFDPQDSTNNVNSDLPDQTHDEIIEMTVSSMLSDIGDFGKQQQFTNLNDNE